MTEPTTAGSTTAEAALVESTNSSMPQLDLMAEQGTAWRGELSQRLSRYRARRKAPPPRYPSLRMPFDPIESRGTALHLPETSLFPTFEPVSNHALALDGAELGSAAVEELPVKLQDAVADHVSESGAPAGEPTSEGGAIGNKTTGSMAVGAKTMSAKASIAKIIEFPRFAWAPPSPPPDQLAEPVIDRPRILEVPEVAPPLPALGGITIEPAAKQEIEKRPGIDIPLQTAPLGQRMTASLIDGAIVAVASALFGFIFWKVTAVRPPRLQIFGFAAAAICLFWAAYQYLLIVYGGNTVGLRVAKLELNRFDGTLPNRSARRWRVLASFLSAASVGMGYIWVFLDEDVLCWHDRITHTYLAPRK
jgi:uncharacterized RDD family membrane protein YckC